MRLIVCILFMTLIACEAPVLPSPLAGRYYGFDTIESINIPFLDTAYAVNEIYLDRYFYQAKSKLDLVSRAGR